MLFYIFSHVFSALRVFGFLDLGLIFLLGFFCLSIFLDFVWFFFKNKIRNYFQNKLCQQHPQAPSTWGWNSRMAVITSYTWKAKHELCQMVPTGTYILHIPPCILQICREMGMAGEEQKSFVLYPLAVVRALQCNDLTHVKTNSKQMAPKNHLNSQDSES